MWNTLRACAVSGHRNLNYENVADKTEQAFLSLIEEGYDTFLVGMAVGFDFLCFKILEKLREYKDIKIIACIPCPGQPLKYSEPQKREYERMLSVADDKIVLSENYTPYCMLKRNAFMVDNSDCLLCFMRKDKGGTYYTYNYAKRKNRRIIEI